jgi:hypothetical protein
MSKSNRKSLFVRLVDWVWRNPKANISEGIKKTCDDMLPKQRLLVVTVLLSVFVLVAFFVFGHACYKIGARQAHNEIEIEHLENIELPSSSDKYIEEYKKECLILDDDPVDMDYESSEDTANDSTRMEGKD